MTPVPQDESQATHVGKIDKSMGRLDFHRTAVELDRQIRGLNSWPSCFCRYHDKQLKIWEAKPLPEEKAKGEPGGITEVAKDFFTVQTGEGLLQVTSVQLEGKKRMAVKDFLLGVRMEAGEKLEQ